MMPHIHIDTREELQPGDHVTFSGPDLCVRSGVLRENPKDMQWRIGTGPVLRFPSGEWNDWYRFESAWRHDDGSDS
jgi:hypothetical protein